MPPVGADAVFHPTPVAWVPDPAGDATVVTSVMVVACVVVVVVVPLMVEAHVPTMLVSPPVGKSLAHHV